MMLKHFNLFFLKCLILLICLLPAGSPPVTSFASENRLLPGAGLTISEFEDHVRQYVGTPYRRGGKTEKGLDCSGFVKKIYEELFGIDLPHNSTAQFKFRDLKAIPSNDLLPGDLVFFTSGKNRIDHVGVYLSGNSFIHASSSGGIRITSLEDRYWKKRVAGTRRHPSLILDDEPPDSIRLGYSVTDNIRFSILGRHDRQTTSYGGPGDALLMNTESSDLSMTFDFSY